MVLVDGPEDIQKKKKIRFLHLRVGVSKYSLLAIPKRPLEGTPDDACLIPSLSFFHLNLKRLS